MSGGSARPRTVTADRIRPHVVCSCGWEGRRWAETLTALPCPGCAKRSGLRLAKRDPGPAKVRLGPYVLAGTADAMTASEAASLLDAYAAAEPERRTKARRALRMRG